MGDSDTTMSSPAFMPGGRTLGAPAAAITLLSVAAQVLALASQALIASIFGASADLDAFLAASTLPQYVVAVVLGALAAVFVPVFVEFDQSGRSTEAWHVASSVVTMTGIVLTVLAVVGLLFAEPLLRLTTPGLSPATLQLAVRVARVTWPSIAVAGITGLVTGIYHSKGRFTWPAVVPAVAAVVNLVLIVAFAREWGVVAIAVAAIGSVVVQALLLIWNLAGRARLWFSFDWHHPGVAQVLVLVWPLALSNVVIRYTPVVDRYLASNLAEGTIAHLGYAFRLATFASMLLSVGITTVIYPRMVANIAARDVDAMRKTVSLALRVMWLGVAPVIAIGVALAQPFIAVLLERGAFHPDDTIAVSAIWRMYIFSLAGACLGGITGRAFYALKATPTIAIMGVVEAAGYAVYTPILARQFGAVGVAAGYVLLFSLSMVWHLPLLRRKLGGQGGTLLLSSFARTSVSATVAALAAGATATLVRSSALGQLAVGGIAGTSVYAGLLALSGGPEIQWTAQALLDARRSMFRWRSA